MSEVVRTLAGPFGTRTCTVDSGLFTWRETPTRPLSGQLGPEQLDALRGVLPHGPCRAIVPRLSVDGPVWSPVPGSRLAFDVVFTDPTNATARQAFRRLGEFLAELHDRPVPEVLRDAPAAEHRGYPVDERLTTTWAAARARLADRIDPPGDQPSVSGPAAPGPEVAGPEVAGPTVAGPIVAGPVVAGPVLTHGRFSLGTIAWGDPPALLGWREAGPGHPAVDTDRLLAELAEAASVTGCGDAIRALAVAFTEAYAQRRPWPGTGHQEMRDRIVGRVLDHLAVRVAVSGDLAGAAALLDRVARDLDGFTGAVVAATEGTRHAR